MKKITKVLSTILIVLLCIAFLLYDAYYIEPVKIRVRRETLSAEKIPLSMDNIQIAFLSDIDYGTYFTSAQLDKLVNKLNACAPDIVLFGGNLINSSVTLDEDTQSLLITALSKIEAPLGKFAVYGEQDHSTPETLSAITTILNSSGFEILENSSISLRNKSSDAISLVGIDNMVNGTVDIDTAYSNVPRDNYVITLCNTPDTCDRVPTDLTDYFLAGHSLGGQIYYIFSSYYTPSGATSHLRGKEKISNSFTLDITSGVGTLTSNVRLFSPSEIVIYTLQSEKPQPTPTPEPTVNPAETASPQQTPSEESSSAPEQATSEPEQTSEPSQAPAE